MDFVVVVVIVVFLLLASCVYVTGCVIVKEKFTDFLIFQFYWYG